MRLNVIAKDFTTERNNCMISALNRSICLSIWWYFNACYDHLLLEYKNANETLQNVNAKVYFSDVFIYIYI